MKRIPVLTVLAATGLLLAIAALLTSHSVDLLFVAGMGITVVAWKARENQVWNS